MKTLISIAFLALALAAPVAQGDAFHDCMDGLDHYNNLTDAKDAIIEHTWAGSQVGNLIATRHLGNCIDAWTEDGAEFKETALCLICAHNLFREDDTGIDAFCGDEVAAEWLDWRDNYHDEEARLFHRHELVVEQFERWRTAR